MANKFKEKQLDKILAKFNKKSDIPKIKAEILELMKPKEGERIIVMGQANNMKKVR